MQGEIRPLDVDVRPDHVGDLVLGGPPVAAIEEEGEDGLGLPTAGLGAAPAMDRLAIALDTHRSKSVHAQGRCRRCVDEGVVEVGATTSEGSLLCAERGKRVGLLVAQLADVERCGEIARGVVKQRGLARGIWAPVEARTEACLAVPPTLGHQGNRQGRFRGRRPAAQVRHHCPRIGRDQRLPKAEVPR